MRHRSARDEGDDHDGQTGRLWSELGFLAAASSSPCCRKHTTLFLQHPSTVVLVCHPGRLTTSHLRDAHRALHRLEFVTHLQLISRHPVNHHTVASASVPHRQPAASSASVSVLPWTAVLVRPMDHELVPPHRRATPAERAALLRTAGALRNLPVLRSDDAIAQYLGLQHGEVVRIDRLDGTVYWRWVVSPTMPPPTTTTTTTAGPVVKTPACPPS